MDDIDIALKDSNIGFSEKYLRNDIDEPLFFQDLS
jgi:hypothetical protein